MAKTLQNHPEYAKANNVNEEFGDMAISKDFKMNSEYIGTFWQKYIKPGIDINSPTKAQLARATCEVVILNFKVSR